METNGSVDAVQVVQCWCRLNTVSDDTTLGSSHVKESFCSEDFRVGVTQLLPYSIDCRQKQARGS